MALTCTLDPLSVARRLIFLNLDFPDRSKSVSIARGLSPTTPRGYEIDQAAL